MKKVLFFITLFVMSMVLIPSVYAETASSESDLTRLLGDGVTTSIELEKDGNYDGTYTINKNVTINGNGATIKGSISVTGGEYVEISDLTITKSTTPTSDEPYIEVNTTTEDLTLTLSNVTIYTGTKDDSSSFTAGGTGLKVTQAKNSMININNSIIQTKYAVWMYGGDCELYVTDSELSGYAALDLTSNSDQTANNYVEINNSTLTGYAIGSSANSDDYGTIVVGNKDNVSIKIINGSKITNSFENSKNARNDLILMSDYEGKEVTSVSVKVYDSELINTNDNLGAVYNANKKDGNTFETENTTIKGTLIANPVANEFYVDFVVDGKSNVVLAKDGKLNSYDIPNVSKKGYTFVGWFDAKGKLFDTKAKVTEDMTVTAKFTKAAKSETNPATGDNLLTYVSLGAISLIGALGTGLYLKKVNE